MTDPDVTAVTRILTRATTDGADPTWTATAILDALRRRGWRPTPAMPAADWHTRRPGTGPTAEYLAARPPSKGDTQP